MFSITAFSQQILFYLTNKPLNVTEEAIVPRRVGIMVKSDIFRAISAMGNLLIM